MTWLFLLGALGASLSIPSAASFRVQELVQIPALPAQRVYSTKTDSQGNLVVSAWLSMPLEPPPNSYGLIKKLDSNGEEQFSLFLPGADQMPIAIDSHDDIYVAGCTYAQAQFPFTSRPGFLFVMKLRGGDGTIVFSTSLAYGSCPTGIAVDSSGQVILVGNGQPQTTAGAYASPPGDYSWSQVSIVRYSPATDQIVFSVRYGGKSIACFGSDCVSTVRTTSANAVLLDRQGNIWVAGATNTTDLPITPDALKTTCGCLMLQYDGFFAKFSGDGTRLLYATYIGTGTGPIGVDGDDRITAAAFDAAGRLWMAGTTEGDDFPVTPNAVQKQRADADGSQLTDGFLAGYDPAANRLVYASYFGGQGNDRISNLQIAADGTVLFAGHSESAALPVGAGGFTRGTDFVASLDPASGGVSGLTRFANGTTGTGLATTPTGLVVSGVENVVTYLQTGNDNGPSLYAVTNAGGGAVTGQVSVGEVISLYGVHIGPPSPVVADLSSGQTPKILGGVQVLFDGAPAPVFYVQDDQINAIVPFSVVPAFMTGTTRLVINKDGVSSDSAVLGVVAASPEAFKIGGTSQAAALNEDATVNTATNRAHPGSIVSVFATGFGWMFPFPVDGQVLGGDLPALTESVQVGSPDRAQPFEITYAGPAPGFAAGVVQVNFRLPSDMNLMEPELVFTVGGWPGGTFTVLVNNVSAALAGDKIAGATRGE